MNLCGVIVVAGVMVHACRIVSLLEQQLIVEGIKRRLFHALCDRFSSKVSFYDDIHYRRRIRLASRMSSL